MVGTAIRTIRSGDRVPAFAAAATYARLMVVPEADPTYRSNGVELVVRSGGFGRLGHHRHCDGDA
jgi:hypothetical protein